MPKKTPYARIAITLPPEELAAADRLARAQDRSRSWIVAEAIRRFAASQDASGRSPPAGAAARTAPVATGLGESRLAQLRRDLSLTPEARVRAAEETLRLTELTGAPAVQQVVAFDDYEAFLDWKWRRDVRR
jgi:hypothetical protein